MRAVSISVIVPVYNTEAYLRKCIESILQQTYQDLEVILVDDGSTDSSIEICRAFCQRDERVRFFQKEHGGQILARKYGLERARGGLIAFVDSDDWIEQEMYEELICCYRDTGCDLVSSGIIRDYAATGKTVCVMDNYEEMLYERLEEQIYPTMLYSEQHKDYGLYCVLVNKLFRRDKLLHVFSHIDERVFYGEDALILYDYCMQIGSIYILRKAFYHYNIRPGSTCFRPDERLPYNNFLLYSGLKEIFMKAEGPYVLMRQLKRYVLRLEFHNLKFLYGIDTGTLGTWEFEYPEELFHKRFVLYGAGGCGQALFREVRRLHKEKDMVAWVDRDAAGRKEECLHEVVYPDAIPGLEYDIIVIAIKEEGAARQIMEWLQKTYLIEKERLIWRPVKNIPISEGIRF